MTFLSKYWGHSQHIWLNIESSHLKAQNKWHIFLLKRQFTKQFTHFSLILCSNQLFQKDFTIGLGKRKSIQIYLFRDIYWVNVFKSNTKNTRIDFQISFSMHLYSDFWHKIYDSIKKRILFYFVLFENIIIKQ